MKMMPRLMEERWDFYGEQTDDLFPSFRILHVEDSPFDTKWLKAILSQMRTEDPFEIVHTRTIGKALTLLQREPFDIVVTDLGLPDSEKEQTVRKLQTHFPWVPTIVLTANEDPKIAIESIKNGARDYFIKRRTRVTDLVRSLRFAMHSHPS